MNALNRFMSNDVRASMVAVAGGVALACGELCFCRRLYAWFIAFALYNCWFWMCYLWCAWLQKQ